LTEDKAHGTTDHPQQKLRTTTKRAKEKEYEKSIYDNNMSKGEEQRAGTVLCSENKQKRMRQKSK
jgi:hypothetical protein